MNRGDPADKAGIREGDIITRIGGEAIDERKPFLNLLLRHRPDETVEIAYARDGRERTTQVKLGHLQRR